MQQHFNYSLKEYNTFGFDASCDRICFIETEEDLADLLPIQEPVFILGGGSNVLFAKDISKVILKPTMSNMLVIEENDDWLIVQVGAGKVWHDFVEWAVNNNYGGIENLSLIPGTVGAAPIQNIGAYGVEIEEVFVGLHAYKLSSGTKEYFPKDICAFGYRDSIFKQEMKGKYLVTDVQFKLTKQNHKLVYSYKPLKELLQKSDAELSVKEISNAVISIRQSKLPDPKVIGNAGSFFKNPIVDRSVFEKLSETHPNAPSYSVSDSEVKIPAAWLIDQLGWKGHTVGDVGVHEKHALVLVNYGNGKGTQIIDLAKKITTSVKETFDIDLEKEVQLIL
jgi:UDP-N-acetylmuramate dehydrogenase